MGYTVNAVALRNHSSVGLIRERSDSPIFLHLLLEFIPSEFCPLHSEFHIDTMAEIGKNRKGTWISIQNMLFGSQGLLDTESWFRTFLPPPPLRLPLPAAMALGFSKYKTSPVFLHDLQSFPGKLRTTTYPPSFMYYL